MKTATGFLLAALAFSPALQAKNSITLDDFANGSVKVSDFLTPPQPTPSVTPTQKTYDVIAPYTQANGCPPCEWKFRTKMVFGVKFRLSEIITTEQSIR